jgi:hypothetical protein
MWVGLVDQAETGVCRSHRKGMPALRFTVRMRLESR